MKEAKTPRVAIHVEQEDIDLAIPKDSSHCMIADAIKACLVDASSVSVDIQTIRWTNRKKRERYVYLTPAAVQWAIVKFDEGKPVPPFSFHLSSGQVLPARDDLGRARRKYLVRKGGRKGASHIHGGKAPPTTFVGRRREFGLKSLSKLTKALR